MTRDALAGRDRPTVFYCTSCCRDKRSDKGPLPAIERYLSPRIAYVAELARQAGRPLLILSGRFGLLGAEDDIPYYNQALTQEAVGGLVETVARQLREQRPSQVVFFARSTPDWVPYHDLLRRACETEGVVLEVRTIHADVPEQ